MRVCPQRRRPSRSRLACSSSKITRLQRRKSNSPSAVTATRFPVRSSKRQLSCSSSVLKEWLTADWVTKIRRAASVKLPSSTTATNALNCLKSGTQSIDESLSLKIYHQMSIACAKSPPLAFHALMPAADEFPGTTAKQPRPPQTRLCSAQRLRAHRRGPETGIFERYGLNVVLSRELGWASVRDKMFYGDLDAAQSIAGIAFALGMGFSELRCEVAVPLILNLHGNAITLSTDLSPAEIGKGEGLQDYLTSSWKKDRPFTLAATHRFSSHHILLYQWLRRHGISCPADVEIIFLPPPLMPRHLKAGHIDGYCVGEPWNSESILAGTGWCPATSSDLSHGHPEKVLLRFREIPARAQG